MSKLKLSYEFNMPEDAEEMNLLLRAGKYKNALVAIQDWARSSCKYGCKEGKILTTCDGEETVIGVEELKALLWDLITEEGLTGEDL